MTSFVKPNPDQESAHSRLDLPILVTRPSIPPLEEYVAEISSIWESRYLTNSGPKAREFETKLASELGTQSAVVFSNGHMALESVLQTLAPEGEVITTPFTFASTVHAIVRSGLKPVFADVRPEDFTLDPDKVRACITHNTACILPVHVYGRICDVESFERISKEFAIPVVYDAAHAFGVKIDGVPVGSFGHASMFSLHATKVLNSVEGGVLTSNRSDLVERVQRWKNFGLDKEGSCSIVGPNAKMHEFSAAMGLCNIRHLTHQIALRKRSDAHYREALESVPGIELIHYPENTEPNYAYFPILVDPEEFGMTRDELTEKLHEKGVHARKYFYPLVSDFECYEGQEAGDFPIAREVSDRIVALPQYAELRRDQINYICDIILSSYRTSRGPSSAV